MTNQNLEKKKNVINYLKKKDSILDEYLPSSLQVGS